MKRKKVVKTSRRVAFSIEDLQKIIFTKDDAREFKNELQQEFATIRRELADKASKADLENLEKQVIDLRNTMATKEDLRLLQKQIIHTIFEEHEPQLKNHEKRIKKLETATFPG